MNGPPKDFEFAPDRPSADETTRVVRIPAGLNRKRRVLAEYARQLPLPEYFGWNWDAFEECLRDLTGLEGVRQVIILHRDVPFPRSPEMRRVYLSILQQRLNEQSDRGPLVRVIFPRTVRNEVRIALADPAEDSSA